MDGYEKDKGLWIPVVPVSSKYEFATISPERALVPVDFNKRAIVLSCKTVEKKKRTGFWKKLRQIPREKLIKAMIVIEVIAILLTVIGIYWGFNVESAINRSRMTAKKYAIVFAKNTVLFDDGSETTKASAGKAVMNVKMKHIRDLAAKLEYIPEEENVDGDIENTETYKTVQGAYSWSGSVLSRSVGTVTGPNGRETYYNLNMSGVVDIMRNKGNTDTYWVRSDGCKMLGNYIMVAANMDVYPRGSIVRSSRGLAIVCDTGGFARSNPNQLDIAVDW
ncbi:MAG TPA: hypothetical protein GX736_03250 [Mogibacterium sp.]|nr:hypothetical protein [Mogibacterium sp.]